jgi:hypothetical protein
MGGRGERGEGGEGGSESRGSVVSHVPQEAASASSSSAAGAPRNDESPVTVASPSPVSVVDLDLEADSGLHIGNSHGTMSGNMLNISSIPFNPMRCCCRSRAIEEPSHLFDVGPRWKCSVCVSTLFG